MIPNEPSQTSATGQLPADLRWLFPEVDFVALDAERDRAFVLGRVLERGRLADVRWALETYGDAGVLAFLRHSGCVELSSRTLGFWRAYFKAENESWNTPPAWRRNNSAHWPG